MGCSVHCKETGTFCGNWDVGLACAWTNGLLAAFAADPDMEMDDAIKSCSKVHYDALDMDEMLKPFIGQPEAFCDFLRDKWHWIVIMDSDGKHLIADENKADCVCPLVKTGAASSPNLCKCSEGFAERMFSKVFARPVRTRVKESILRGGSHCVYEIILD